MTSHPNVDSYQERFDRDGYIEVPGALDPYTLELLGSTIGTLESTLTTAGRRRDIFGLDARPLFDLDPIFRELMTWPSTFPLAVYLLGHFNVQLMTSHLIVVPPHSPSRNVEWHRDGGTPDLEVCGVPPLYSLKVGYFLNDVDAGGGALTVLPGSHRRPLTIDETGADPPGAVELTPRAGTAVIFHQGLAHCGAPNRSDRARTVIYYGYGFRFLRPLDYQLVDPEFLQGCSPLEQQLLGVKHSHLGYVIPTQEDCPLQEWAEQRFGERWEEVLRSRRNNAGSPPRS